MGHVNPTKYVVVKRALPSGGFYSAYALQSDIKGYERMAAPYGVRTRIHTCAHTLTCAHTRLHTDVQGGEDPQDALSL